MKKIVLPIIFSLVFSSVLFAQEQDRIIELKENLEDSKNEEIIIVAHRGDWRNAPENSIMAIENCIEMGIDMVEIDVAETKDGHLVLMHDKTIDRTTNGSGLVKDWNLADLKELFLVDGANHKTPHKIPTLEEALLACKGKILVNLDKSYSIFDKCFEIAKKTGTLDHIIIKGAKSKKVVESEFGKYLDKVYFMPVIRLKDENADEISDEYLKKNPPVAIEFVFPNDSYPIISTFKNIREKGASVWVNSLWPELNGNHDDERAVKNIKEFDWYIENGVDIIQTDRPLLLLKYLQSKGLHK